MRETEGNVSLETMLDIIAERLAVRVAGKLSGNQSTPGPRLLNIDQAAAYLNRSAPSLRHLVATGKLKSVRLDGRVFLDVRDLDHAIDEAKS